MNFINNIIEHSKTAIIAIIGLAALAAALATSLEQTQSLSQSLPQAVLLAGFAIGCIALFSINLNPSRRMEHSDL